MKKFQAYKHEYFHKQYVSKFLIRLSFKKQVYRSWVIPRALLCGLRSTHRLNSFSRAEYSNKTRFTMYTETSKQQEECTNFQPRKMFQNDKL